MITANRATARLLEVTTFPSLCKISSDFGVNLLICPRVGILFLLFQQEGNHHLCFRLRPLKLIPGGSASHAKHLFCGSSCMIRFQMTRGNPNRCFWITWWNTSETPPPGYQIPPRPRVCYWTIPPTGGLGWISFCSYIKCRSAAVKSLCWCKKLCCCSNYN